jgi:hypothetical protein
LRQKSKLFDSIFVASDDFSAYLKNGLPVLDTAHAVPQPKNNQNQIPKNSITP